MHDSRQPDEPSGPPTYMQSLAQYRVERRVKQARLGAFRDIRGKHLEKSAAARLAGDETKAIFHWKRACEWRSSCAEN